MVLVVIRRAGAGLPPLIFRQAILPRNPPPPQFPPPISPPTLQEIITMHVEDAWDFVDSVK